MAGVFEQALSNSIISNDDTAVIFYDLDFLKVKTDELKNNMGIKSLNAIAIKANPLVAILKYLNSWGMGAEAASLPELYLAQKVGFSPDKIVFDSPAKTNQELAYAIKYGVHVNADSLDELKRIDDIIKANGYSGSFGLRVNPQIGVGKISITSVAGDYSKFGVPIRQYWQEIIEAFKQYEWLTGIHLHIGSQGIPVEMLVAGVKTVYELADGINAALAKSHSRNRIVIFDIGGGMPVSYSDRDMYPTIKEYADNLKSKVPGLFDGRYTLITEFGRWVQANAGWAVSRVEYIKKQDEFYTAIIHLGADMFVRRCYNPEFWHHDIAVLDREGCIKSSSGSDKKYIIGGPLCFAGDIIARDISLPEINPGDYILIRDTGAYTLSMWSRYNSRQVPKIIGYFDKGRKFEILKERESLEDLYRFWL